MPGGVIPLPIRHGTEVHLGFWTAWRFLTIFPAPGTCGTGTERIGASLVFFPLVGLILGGALLGLDRLFDLFLPPFLASGLILVALVIFTGALHLDGFMDTCDGFAVRKSPEERLRIMSDSRVGGFGVAGACCLILLKFAALVSLPEELRAAALLTTPALSRWTASWAIIVFPSAKKTGIGQLYKEKSRPWAAPGGTVLALAIAAGFWGSFGAALVGGIGVIALLTGLALSKRLGGLTGDTYGAIIEISEVCALIGAVIIGKAGGTSWIDLSS